MFNELLKAKRKWYGKEGIYPEAIRMTEEAYKELDLEAKILKIGVNQAYTGHSVNGMRIFIDKEQKEDFIFGYHHNDKFYETAF